MRGFGCPGVGLHPGVGRMTTVTISKGWSFMQGRGFRRGRGLLCTTRSTSHFTIGGMAYCCANCDWWEAHRGVASPGHHPLRQHVPVHPSGGWAGLAGDTPPSHTHSWGYPLQCDPNLQVYNVFIENLDERLPRIALFATRPIRAGEELTFDYNMHGTVPQPPCGFSPRPTSPRPAPWCFPCCPTATLRPAALPHGTNPCPIAHPPCHTGQPRCHGVQWP